MCLNTYVHMQRASVFPPSNETKNSPSVAETQRSNCWRTQSKRATNCSAHAIDPYAEEASRTQRKKEVHRSPLLSSFRCRTQTPQDVFQQQRKCALQCVCITIRSWLNKESSWPLLGMSIEPPGYQSRPTEQCAVKWNQCMRAQLSCAHLIRQGSQFDSEKKV